jgi:hypothetical protein
VRWEKRVAMEDPGEARDGQDRYELVIPVPAGQTPAEAVNLGMQLRRLGETGPRKRPISGPIDSGGGSVLGPFDAILADLSLSPPADFRQL